MAEHATRPETATDINGAIRNMIAIIDQLVEITEEENRLYEDGHPAPPAGIVAMKSAQADQLNSWFEGVRNHEIELKTAEPGLRSLLINRVKRMRSVMEENAGRLARARAASKRRVDAIMQVVREQTRPRPTAYGDSGRMTERRGSPPPTRISTEI